MQSCRPEILPPELVVSDSVSGLILAGGRATRMGGQDKGLVSWHGQTLVSHVQQVLQPQVQQLYINANRNRQRYEDVCGCQVLADNISGFHGPLAGIRAALEVATTAYIAVVPCDTPYIPPDLVARLTHGIGDSDIAVAHDGTRLQSLHLLLHTGALQSLQKYMDNDGRKPDQWYQQHGYATVDFSDVPQAFINFNTLDDLS